MTRPRLLDLFCCAGGAAMGYHRAGFDVVGVDLEPQPRFPFLFVQADAINFVRRNGHHFDVIAASPPCQANLKGLAAANRALGRAYDHHDLVPAVREALLSTGKPYVIEQPMKGARLVEPVRYCGTSFGLPIFRHRQFESNASIFAPACEHDRFSVPRYWTGYGVWGKKAAAEGGRARKLSRVVQVYGNGGDQHEWGPALGIDWMTPEELTQAIPPAYTQHIGEQIMHALHGAVTADTV